jgi:hypothetical protein
MTHGTADKGALSESMDWVSGTRDTESWTRGGEEVKIAVEEVGTGVGYVDISPPQDSRASRLTGLGSGGDEDGSKGGRSIADRLVPTTERDMAFGRGGEESIGTLSFLFSGKRTNKKDLAEREITRN